MKEWYETSEDPKWLNENNPAIVFDWVEYKGLIYYAHFNYDRSIKAGRPMIDLSYCATKALHNIVIKTVQWDKKKFKLFPKV